MLLCDSNRNRLLLLTATGRGKQKNMSALELTRSAMNMVCRLALLSSPLLSSRHTACILAVCSRTSQFDGQDAPHVFFLNRFYRFFGSTTLVTRDAHSHEASLSTGGFPPYIHRIAFFFSVSHGSGLGLAPVRVKRISIYPTHNASFRCPSRVRTPD